MSEWRPMLLFAFLLAACSQSPEDMRAYYEREGDRLDALARDKRVAFTYEAFVASPNYRTSRDVWRGAALQQYAPRQSRVEILLKEQRGRLYIKDQIAMDFPVCTGRVGGKETPKGTFRITEKKEAYRSNLYGSFVDAQGKYVKTNVHSSDTPPVGTKFLGSNMPYWMRFNGSIGMHVGSVYRESRSHGCVRIPVEACSTLFEKLAVGSVVVVK